MKYKILNIFNHIGLYKNRKSKEYSYALTLARFLHNNNYNETTFIPHSDLLGLLTQIDNMLTGVKIERNEGE